MKLLSELVADLQKELEEKGDAYISLSVSWTGRNRNEEASSEPWWGVSVERSRETTDFDDLATGERAKKLTVVTISGMG
jgi:hypothetical protein